MTALARAGQDTGGGARRLVRRGRLARLAGLLRDMAVGGLLCSGPVTAIIALGWLTRRSGQRIRDGVGLADEAPGWLCGRRDKGRIVRALGGGAANIRAGMLALAALLVWTLPFTLLWLGAWWAGWENSFNKGYEQAFVGPAVFLTGALLAGPILPILPLMLAHLAAEDRLAAAFELRRLRSVVAQSGWRLPALAAATLVCALPLAAARGLIATAPAGLPWIADLDAAGLEVLQGQITLGLAVWTFLSVWGLRVLAARLYLQAAPRAAGAKPGLWDGSLAAEGARPAKPRSRLLTAGWIALAAGCGLTLSFLILAGQFLDYAWWRWLFHPAVTLPWPG